jgi:hypothetical protein
MRRRLGKRPALVTTFVAAFLCAAPAHPAAGDGPPSAASSLTEVEAAVVQIVTIPRGEGTRTARGSAFYVGADGHLLTCAHVLDQMPNDEAPRLRLRGGAERSFEVVRVDRELDLALLFSDPPERFLALGDRFRPEVGQAVLLAGFAARGDAQGGEGPRFKRAQVAGLERRWAAGVRRTVRGRRKVLTIKVDQLADRGQSGGPLLASGTFVVLGVLRANLESATGGLGGGARRGHGAAVPLLYVRPFVDSALPE